jgi:peptidoglycan/xylan/chitin deacetylase (PgdA/CDA1 family)
MNDTTNLKTGYFLFSLDTELAWGYFDRFRSQMFSNDGRRERFYIERLLDVFDEFNITATWAIVGFLFHEQHGNNLYPNDWKGKYPLFENLYHNKHALLYGADVIETLLSRGNRHEIAFHGYVHRILEEGKTSEEQAKAEIQTWLRAAQRKNIVPQTVIFPRNKIGHLKLFKEHGFICYRGEEPTPRIYSRPFLGKPFRRFYYYLATFSALPLYEPEIDQTGLINLPSSRWLFGFNRKWDHALDRLNLHTLRLRKIAQGIARAALEKKIIHIWAHSHEFQTAKDIEKLRYLLCHVAKYIQAGSMKSVSMAELARQTLEEHHALNSKNNDTKQGSYQNVFGSTTQV